MLNLGQEPEIVHMKSPTTGFRFEWHSRSKKLYIVMDDHEKKQSIATLIAENILSHGEAINMVHMWVRGYKFAKHEDTLKGESNATKQRAADLGILAVAGSD